MNIFQKCLNPILGPFAEWTNKFNVSDIEIEESMKEEYTPIVNCNTVVILDNGHGSDTPGKRSPDGKFREYAYVRKVVEAIHEKLEALGVKSHILVPEEKDIDLPARCSRANKIYDENNGNVILVSVHNNAAGSGSKWMNANGWSVYVDTTASDNSEDLAACIAFCAEDTEIKVRKETIGRNFWVASLYILKHTKCPAVLTENMFMDNEKDVSWLESEEGFKTIVELHIKGILAYLALQKRKRA
jgi:N-acetylmuramoyl-L-alanine amidase